MDPTQDPQTAAMLQALMGQQMPQQQIPPEMAAGLSGPSPSPLAAAQAMRMPMPQAQGAMQHMPFGLASMLAASPTGGMR